jgi:hypothetical protein
MTHYSMNAQLNYYIIIIKITTLIIMKKLKTKMFIASVLAIGVVVISTPFTSFAQENNNNKQEVKVSSNNSIWNRLTNIFRPNEVSAATPVENQTPSISGVTAPTVLNVGEMGTWTVNASDPQNGSLSYAVDWGDTAMQPLARIAQAIFTQTSTFTHAYITAGTYTVTFTVSNSAGLKTTSTVTVHVMESATVNAPVISNFTATATKPRQATLAWTTDVNSTSLAWYGTASPVDTSGTPKVTHTGKILNHSITLTGLTPSTKYYVVVGSANDVGTTMSTEGSFTTTALPGENTPVITSVAGNQTIAAGATETVTVNAYDPKNGSLTYSADWGDSASMMTMALAQQPFTQTATFSHIYNTPGTYTATFTAKNSVGNVATSSMIITVTSGSGSGGPVVSGVGATVATVISWTTDVPATSKVFYSTTTPVDVNSSATPVVTDSSSVTTHSVTIPGLTPNTKYYFVIQSTDSSGNTGTSSESSFTTQAS